MAARQEAHVDDGASTDRESRLPDDPGDEGARTARDPSMGAYLEGRLAEIAVLTRLGTAPFLCLPLLTWPDLLNPGLAVISALLGAAEAVAFALAVRRRGLLTYLVVTDVATCLLLMAVGSRAVAPADRNVVMTELIPFALGASATVGISSLPLRRAGLLVGSMMVGWVVVLLPVLPLKTFSDELGFLLWVTVGRLVSVNWRRLGAAVDRAQRDTAAAREELAERDRLAAIEARRRQEARHREVLHRQVHDELLPVVEHVANGREMTPAIAAWARSTARRARLHLENELAARPAGLLAQLAEAVADAEARGIVVTTSLATDCAPAPEVVDVLGAAVREALTNVVNHAGPSTPVFLAALDAGTDGVQITIRDRGQGFDPDRVRPGGGLSRSYCAVSTHGGQVNVESAPGRGTCVRIDWAPSATPGDPGG